MINNLKESKTGKHSWYLPHFILFAILLASVGLMFGSSVKESAIMDELAHIPAGYGYVNFLDYRLNPEHPPLIKALSAIPLLFMNLNFPTSFSSWNKDVNGQWDAGRQFLYEVNNGIADNIIQMSRIMPIVLTILLIVLVYSWAQRLFGSWWALAPAFFTAFSPHILAHGHYVTTDIGASLGFFLGLFGFALLLEKISWKSILCAGLLFGVAELLKFSLVLLIPLYVFFACALWISKSIQEKYGIFSKGSFLYAWKLIKTLILVFVIGYALVWAVYLLFTWNYPIEKQVFDTTTLLTDLRNEGSILAEVVTWMSGVPIIRAIGHYALGVIMVGQRSSGGNMAYFLGEDGNGGWWNYFPSVFLLKESVPALLVILLGFIFWAFRFFKNRNENWRPKMIIFNIWNRITYFVSNNTAFFIMVVFVLFYWLYSVQSPLNIGFRHILPTIPFIYILAIGSIKKWFDSRGKTSYDGGSSIKNRLLYVTKNAVLHGVMGIVIIWVVLEVWIAYPQFISYFNEFGGGKWNGYIHVVDSNYDWGQDLKRLQEYVNNEGISNIAIDYFGGGHVPYYVPNSVLWDESMGNPIKKNIEWLAVSVNELIYDINANDHTGEEYNNRRYRWLKNPLEPYDRVGTSIFIYRLR